MSLSAQRTWSAGRAATSSRPTQVACAHGTVSKAAGFEFGTMRDHANSFQSGHGGPPRSAAGTTLPEYLDTSARRYPDKPAIVYCGCTTTYAQLKQRVDALAGFLQQRLGVARGDRVLLVSQNCPQFVAAFYAILRVGAVVVPVNPMSKSAEVRYYAQDSGAKVAFVARDLLGNVPEGLLEAIVTHAYRDALVKGFAADEVPDWVMAQAVGTSAHPAFEDAVACAMVPAAAGIGPDDLAVLPYTSGTTGHPKGCMHTHATVLASLAASQVWKGLNVESVVLAVAPLFHMLGMQNGMNMPIVLGGTAVMMPRWDAGVAARLIERHRVTAWTAPPAMVLDLFRTRRRSGATLPASPCSRAAAPRCPRPWPPC